MMSKEHGWEDYFCHCGKLAGHFYVGFGLERLYRRILMKILTFWRVCPEHRLRLKKGHVFMISTPAPVEDDFIHKIWRESKDVREGRSG